MATTSYGVNANETVKVWGRKLFREAIKETHMRKFMGSSTQSMIQIKDETSKGPGDTVYNILRMRLTGDGIKGDATLEGSEEALTTYRDSLVLDQLRHAVRSGGRMTEQRVPFSVRDEARMSLQDWYAERIDTALMNQLAGNNAQTDTRYTGSQSVTAPDSAHHYWPAAISADETITAGNTLTIDLIDKLVTEAKLAVPVLRPFMMGGQAHYVMFIHPDQVEDLRTSTTTGQWLDIQKAAMQGGRVSDNPIFTGALGVYNQVILHESAYVPTGVHSSTAAAQTLVRRSIFAGAQAATMAFGRNNSDFSMTWFEEMFDYGNQLGVAAGMIWGAKRSIFNSETFGSFVLSTAAVDRG
jgi:N4-gp56 family major capsid protein